MRKLLLSCFATVLCTAGSAFAASFSTGTFGAYNTATGDDLVGQQGWTSPSYTDDLSISMGTGGSWNGGGAFRVGGIYSTPVSMQTNINHAFVDPNFAGSRFSVDFAVFNSQQAELAEGFIGPGDPAQFPGRDKFGWTIRDGSSNQLWRLAFEPATLADHMEIVWYDPSGTRNTLNPPPGWDIINGQKYSLSVDFVASGADISFAASLNTLNFGGTLTGKAASNLGEFGADFDVGGAAVGDAGSNYMVFNNLTMIPEPASAALFALAGFALLGRRRSSPGGV